MYKQIKGTAMPNNTSIYAYVTMNSIDVMVNEGYQTRFRDEFYVPWTHGVELLEVFHEWLNYQLPGIK